MNCVKNFQDIASKILIKYLVININKLYTYLNILYTKYIYDFYKKNSTIFK